jgi:hypothetical protein
MHAARKLLSLMVEVNRGKPGSNYLKNTTGVQAVFL